VSGEVPGQEAHEAAEAPFRVWMHEAGHDPDDMRTYYGVGALAEAFQGGAQAAIAAQEPHAATELAARLAETEVQFAQAESSVDDYRAALTAMQAERDDYAARLRATDQSWAKVAAECDRLRDLLDEIGVMAANAPEDGDSFGVLEEIAMRVAAASVPDATPGAAGSSAALDGWSEETGVTS